MKKGTGKQEAKEQEALRIRTARHLLRSVVHQVNDRALRIYHELRKTIESIKDEDTGIVSAQTRARDPCQTLINVGNQSCSPRSPCSTFFSLHPTMSLCLC